MKINYLFIVVLLLTTEIIDAQYTFHQDIFHGGVTMGGFSTDHQTYGSTGDNPLQLYIEPGSTIRNAYLFHYQVGPSITSTVTLNGTEFVFTGEDEFLNVNRINPIASPVRYLYKNITNFLNNNLSSSFNIEVSHDINEPNFGGFSAFIYIEYENPTLSIVCTNFVVNNLFIDNNITLDISLSQVNNSNPIGLACYFDNITSSPQDEEIILFDNVYLGTLSGSDLINQNLWGGGVKGHFYYQNNSLYGLDDDNENVLIEGNDALTEISNIINGNDFSLTYISADELGPNYPLFFVNAYTTPCDTFSTTISENQTICKGDSVLLTASGGIESYLWNNNETLSDSVSPSVYAIPDSTTTYVVKIENNPGCYRTEQVTIIVNETPQINSIEIFPTTCGDPASGMLQVNSTGAGELDYTINNESTNDNTFENLMEGTYTIAVNNEFNCSVDSIIYLSSEITSNANFNATPIIGDEPLLINTTNNSSLANDFVWLLDDVPFSTEENPSFIIDTNGVYNLSLIAFNNIAECADTFSLNITVKNALLVQIPNIFTPNDDGLNDEFIIKTDDVIRIKTQIYNRWGNHIYEEEKEITPKLTRTRCWNGKNTSEELLANGTYYYIIILERPNGEILDFNGSVMMKE